MPMPHRHARSTRQVAPTEADIALERKFPMYVLPIDKVLSIDCIASHEEMKAELVEYDPSMTVVFCSHTWLRFSHPDDESGSKLKLLQAVLRRGLAGNLHAKPHWLHTLNHSSSRAVPPKEFKRKLKGAYVWLDFWSVPQTDPTNQALAIESIVTYVGDSSYFFVLAGAWEHESGAPRDLRAWSGRGWCKMEQLSDVLVGSNQTIVCESTTSCYIGGFLPQEAWYHTPVGLQQFTVPADAAKLGPVIANMLDVCMARSRACGDMRRYRCVRALRHRVLAGTGVPDPDAALSIDEWLGALGFRSHDDEAESGWTPLLMAVLTCRVELVSELLRRGADVHCAVHCSGQHPIPSQKGWTPLYFASILLPSAPMIKLLLAAGADARQQDRNAKYSPLDYACCWGWVENVDTLLEWDSTLTTLTADLGIPPLMNSAMFGAKAVIENTITKYPEALQRGLELPFNYCTLLISGSGDVPTLRLMLEHGFRHDTALTWKEINLSLIHI